MIKNLNIINYKSIRELDIDTKRVNVFIGEDNSGKSNILEALSWFSLNSLEKEIFPEMFRFKNATNFFYDFDTTAPIEIKTDDLNLLIRYSKNNFGSINNELAGIIYTANSEIDPLIEDDLYNLMNNYQDQNYWAFTLKFDGQIKIIGGSLQSSFRRYIYKHLKSFQSNFRPFLNPPYGENIPSLIISNKELKELVSSLFREKGFRLMIQPNENDINMAKDVNDELYSYPYASISETIQRIVFYTLAIESNKNAVLIFDEPESNTFPMYTKQLAELIALDNSNQYFLATHDPYVLNSLLSKTPSNDIAVFITKMEEYKTIVSEVGKEDLSVLLDKGIDVYFNLNKFISE